MSETLSKTTTSVLSPEAQFLSALNTGVAKVQQCLDCENRFFQPRTHCPKCRSSRYAWVPMTMSGTLHSYTNLPTQGDRRAYNVVLIDMDDGFRMMSNCPGAELDMSSIGQKFNARIDLESAPARIVFGVAL